MSAQDNTSLENVKSNNATNEKINGLAFTKSAASKKPFTIIDRGFMQLTGSQMSDLSFRIICYLMSLPDDWIVYMSHLRGQFDVGKDKLQDAIRELVAKGYIRRRKTRGDGGKFGAWNTEYSDIPEFLADNAACDQEAENPPMDSEDNQCRKTRQSVLSAVGKSGHYITHKDPNILNTTTTKNEPENKQGKVVVKIDNELILELQSYGVYPDTAKLFVKEHPGSYLRAKIAYVNDYKKQGKKIDDMGSLLYQAIVKNWTAPKNEASVSSGAENIDQYMARKHLEGVRNEMEKEVKRGAIVEKLGIQALSRELQDEKIEEYQDQVAKNAIDSMRGRLRENFPCGSVGELVGGVCG